MASRSMYDYNHNTSRPNSIFNRQSPSRNSVNSEHTHTNRSTSQRQLSDSRIPTLCYILFENGSFINSNQIYFLDYLGTRARKHHSHKLYLPQVVQNKETSSDETYAGFANCIKEVLNTIPSNDLSSYVVSIRTGVLYYFSKRFRFNKTYSIEEVHDAVQKKISNLDMNYYYQQRMNNNQSDDSLRSSFSNVKPINRPREFAKHLNKYEFHVKKQKHSFRIYLQSEDKQTHVCTVDPAVNYSIVEFSKDFQRTSNIDFIRDRNSSSFQGSKTYDDIFDFRIQFQYNPRTRSDQMNTIEYELRQEFPSLDSNFKNENILQPFNNDINEDQEFFISEQLCPYVKFIRRDFGDVYQYDGNDELFENYTIYLESSVEYLIDYPRKTCKRTLDSHGLVYARLDLSTMISSSNTINQDLLVSKLWDMGIGLTLIAGQCTTSETQQSTNYYTSDGITFTAEEETLVQTILKQSTLHSMLSLSNNATNDEIIISYNRTMNQLDNKWHCFRCGKSAREKLVMYYEQYFQN